MEFIENKEEFYYFLYRNCHCINAGQTPEERRTKYYIVKSLTGNSCQARRKRDWTTSHIAISLGYKSWNDLIKINLERIEKNGV